MSKYRFEALSNPASGVSPPINRLVYTSFDVFIGSRYVGNICGYVERGAAALISAAPDLLEALSELLDAELTEMPPYEAGKEAQDAWADRRAAARNNARAVIAKAQP